MLWEQLQTRASLPFRVFTTNEQTFLTEGLQSRDEASLLVRSAVRHVIQSHGVVYFNQCADVGF